MSADVPNRRPSGRKRLAPISFWENQIVARASDGSFADVTPNHQGGQVGDVDALRQRHERS